MNRIETVIKEESYVWNDWNHYAVKKVLKKSMVNALWWYLIHPFKSLYHHLHWNQSLLCTFQKEAAREVILCQPVPKPVQVKTMDDQW